jgi:hypothetical protein
VLILIVVWVVVVGLVTVPDGGPVSGATGGVQPIPAPSPDPSVCPVWRPRDATRDSSSSWGAVLLCSKRRKIRGLDFHWPSHDDGCMPRRDSWTTGRTARWCAGLLLLTALILGVAGAFSGPVAAAGTPGAQATPSLPIGGPFQPLSGSATPLTTAGPAASQAPTGAVNQKSDGTPLWVTLAAGLGSGIAGSIVTNIFASRSASRARADALVAQRRQSRESAVKAALADARETRNALSGLRFSINSPTPDADIVSSDVRAVNERQSDLRSSVMLAGTLLGTEAKVEEARQDVMNRVAEVMKQIREVASSGELDPYFDGAQGAVATLEQSLTQLQKERDGLA